MTSVCDTCKRDKCRVRMNGLKMCDMRVTESNWERLFSTPERAARTLEAHMRKCRSADVTLCDSCVMVRSCEEEQALLEWLRGDAE